MTNQESYRKKPPQSDTINTTGTSTYEGVARVAFEIGKRQGADLRRIRDELDAGNNDAALSLMRDFFVLREGSTNATQKKKAQ